MNNDYPVKPVRIIVPLPPGGPADVIARIVGEKLAMSWGQPVVVENQTGDDTIKGTSAVAKAPPDGYTLLVVPSQFSVHPRQRTDLPYDVIKDFAPVTLLALGPNVLVVHSSVPVNTVAELVALAKSKPQELKWASAGGKASASHRGAELFQKMAGIDVEFVSFPGAANAVDGVLDGTANVLLSVMAPAIPHVQAGKLRALAGTGPRRSRVIPDVPTLKEVGFPDFEMTTWQGMLAPAGTAPEVIMKLNRDVAKILEIPEVQQKLSAIGFELTGSTPEEFAARIKKEVGKT